MPIDDSTKTALLDAAQDLAQTRGYNAFSFGDLSNRIGIKTASIHYHFPTKADLGRALVMRYRATLEALSAEIESKTDDPVEQLRRYVAALRGTLKKGTRMCLCGMFGAEFATLPGPMQDEVRQLFVSCETWLGGVLARGKASGKLVFEGDPRRVAGSVFSSLQGAMLAACTFGDETRFTAAADFLILQMVKK